MWCAHDLRPPVAAAMPATSAASSTVRLCSLNRRVASDNSNSDAAALSDFCRLRHTMSLLVVASIRITAESVAAAATTPKDVKDAVDFPSPVQVVLPCTSLPNLTARAQSSLFKERHFSKNQGKTRHLIVSRRCHGRSAKSKAACLASGDQCGSMRGWLSSASEAEFAGASRHEGLDRGRGNR